MSDGEIPGFSLDSEMEALLEEDLFDLDRETRMDVQLYKSRKMQALRDAGISADQIQSSLGRIEHQYGGIRNGGGSNTNESPNGGPPSSERSRDADSFTFESEGEEHPRVGFYRQFKSHLGKGTPSTKGGGSGTDPDRSPDADPKQTPAPSSAERQTGEPRPPSGPAAEADTTRIIDQLLGRIRELEVQVSRYQDRIGTLRERNARLMEKCLS